MGAEPFAILVVHDDDPIGHAVVKLLHASDTPVRTASSNMPADDLACSAFGCRAIIAVGDRFAADPAVLGGANMPGVRGLVVIVRGDVDLKPLRTRGVPYTVLRLAPLVEDVIEELSPHLQSGKLIIDPKDDVPVAAIAVADAAECAVRAVDADDVCGRVVQIAAPDRLRVSELARAVARARGRDVKVVAGWPRWALAALRAIGRRPFKLSAEIRSEPSADGLASLHPGAWLTVEEVARTATSGESRRNDEHATLGV
ncbi:MAG TPA: hypothetical protein VN947_32565 [Polyangia bacterium]|nr:hypothetical protein [Polyangia bacterium]